MTAGGGGGDHHGRPAPGMTGPRPAIPARSALPVVGNLVIARVLGAFGVRMAAWRAPPQWFPGTVRPGVLPRT